MTTTKWFVKSVCFLEEIYVNVCSKTNLLLLVANFDQSNDSIFASNNEKNCSLNYEVILSFNDCFIITINSKIFFAVQNENSDLVLNQKMQKTNIKQNHQNLRMQKLKKKASFRNETKRIEKLPDKRK